MYTKTIYPVLLSLMTLVSCEHEQLIKHECSDMFCVSSRDLSSDEESVVTQEKDKKTVKSDTISIVSSAKNSSSISSGSGREIIPPFEKLSTEEKTELFLELLECKCDQIYYPTYAFSSQSMAPTPRNLDQIKKVKEELLKNYSSKSGTYFESNKVNSFLLIFYKNEPEPQSIKLTRSTPFICGSIQSDIDNLTTSIEKNFKSLQDKISFLEDKIERVSLSLSQSHLSDSKLLLKKIKKYIGSYYNATVIRNGYLNDVFTQEEINNFCDKVVQYKTYDQFKKYLKHRTQIWNDFSDKVYQSHNKIRFLTHLKYFILSINPDINKQSEDITKLKAELRKLKKDLNKYDYFFDIEPTTIALAEGYLEHFLVENLDLSNKNIKKDKVYMLVYASDDICNACTNAIPKVQSLISEKFQQQGASLFKYDTLLHDLEISSREYV